jgi:hypothetical protein
MASPVFFACAPAQRDHSLVSTNETAREPQIEPIDGRLAFSIAELGKLTSLGRQSIYDAINSGRLIARKLGRRTVILRADATRWLASAPPIEPVATPDGAETAAPLRACEPEPTGMSHAPIKNRPQRRRGDRNAPTPPAPPLRDDSNSRFLGRERTQQNPRFLARRRDGEHGVDPDVAPPRATRGLA